MSNAEDPEKILEQAVEDMQNDLVKMRQASAQVMASQKQIERKFEQAQTTAVRDLLPPAGGCPPVPW